MTNRSHRTNSFDPAIELSVTSTLGGWDPTISRDGMLLLFASNRDDGIIRLHAASRSTPVGDFANATPVAGVSSGAGDSQPFLTSDDQELWFTSARTGGAGLWDIYRAGRSGTGFSNPVKVSELNSSSDDWLPVLSEDRLTIYWSSNRAGGPGAHDIWRSRRSTTSDGWGEPMLVPELSSPAHDQATWLSPDGCRMYMSSNRSGSSFDVLVAERQP